MPKVPMRQLSPQFVTGLIVVGLGVLFLLDNFLLIDAGEIIRYWPALLIIYGFVKIIQPAGSPGKTFGALVGVLGVLLLLSRFDVLSFHVHDWWPVILILVGINMLRGTFRRRTQPAENESVIHAFAFMSGCKRQYISQISAGGDITAIMGGCEIDLRQTTMESDEIIIDIFAFWGGIVLRVPEAWTVVTQAIPIIGGVDDRTRPVQTSPQKRLFIRGQVIMGGAEIKN